MHIEKELTIEEILEKIGELNIYSYYIPNLVLNRPMLSIFRVESNPSFVVSSRGTRIRYKDYGDSRYKGGCIDLVKQLFHLSTSEAVIKIKEDFGLVDKSGNKYNQVISSIPKLEIIDKKPVKIIAEAKSFGQEHLDYLAQYELVPEDLNFCEDTEVLALKKFYINGSPITLKKNEVGFIYYVKTLDKVKIYRPNAPKAEKWTSSIPFSHIHGLSNMKNCDTGILTKSLKDGAIINKYITNCVCVIQAENSSCLRSEDIQLLKNSVKNLYIGLDVDVSGKKASYEICSLLDAKHVNPVDRILDKGGTDFADWVRLEGKEAVIQHFINKKIIN